MHPDAIKHAKLRVQKVKTALAQMEAAQNFDTFEAAWTDFLQAANTVYTKLEEGSHSDGKSKAWYGRMKHERRKDELLNYLHHARNSDEHTIAAVTARESGAILIPDNTSAVIRTDEHGNMDISYSMLPGYEPKPPEFRRPHVRLLRVQSLQKDWFEPPTSHKGAKLTSRPDDRVLDVARKGLTYLEWLVAEGEKYAV